MIELNRIYNEDCLEGMKRIADGSVDMILCDLPYGTTACKWDTIIPFEPLWEQYERVIKDNGAIVLTASQPFTSALIMSKPDLFRYEWIWEKAVGSNFAQLKYQPMKEHESVLVFSKNRHQDYPIKQRRKGSGAKRAAGAYIQTKAGEASGGITFKGAQAGHYDKEYRNPSSVQYFNNREKGRGLHPTQKPVALFEYLIKTYTNKGETVLDNCIGSGTTAIACINTNRNYIGFELDAHYCDIANERIQKALAEKEVQE